MFDLCCVDLEMELGLSHEAIAQLQKEEEVEEKAKKVTKDLEHKDISVEIYHRSVENMFNMLMPCLSNIDIMHRCSSRCLGIRFRLKRTSLRRQLWG